jgi:hypothetical protein
MEKVIDHKWKIFVWINILWILGTFAIGIITYYSVPPEGSSVLIETIKIVFLCLGGLGIILPVYISVTNEIEDRYTKKIENTISLLQKWDDPHLFEARKYTRRLKDKRPELSDNQLVSQINNDEELRHSVILVMNYLEFVRISIRENRVDIIILKQSLGPVILDICRRLRPFVIIQGEQPLKHWDELNNFFQ